MSNEELQTVVEAVIRSLKTNGKTIDQLTAVQTLLDGDCFEIGGGRKISYEVLVGLLSEAIGIDTSGILEDIAKTVLQSVTISADGTTATLSIKQAGYVAKTVSIPVATSEQSGIITVADRMKYESAYSTANSASSAAAAAQGGVNTINGKLGVANGIATLDANGKVPTSQLPSTVTIVNDLTTGGTDKALSAEMGKTLKGYTDQIEPSTKENINPNYPSMLAVRGTDYTVLENKSGTSRGTTLETTPGNYCVVVALRAKYLSFVNRKSGYAAVWLYSAEPDSSDYTANRIRTVAMTSTSGTVGNNEAGVKYALIDIGTNIDTFRAWFNLTEPVAQNVVTKIGGCDIKVNASYLADENLFDYAHNKPGGTATISVFEFEVTPGLNYFVMWNDVDITPYHSAGTWIEYDANDNVVLSENFYTYTGTRALLFFGDHKRTAKVLLQPTTSRLRIEITLANGVTLEDVFGKGRMYINSDGHLTRFLYPTAIDGHAVMGDDLRGKVIACFGDSITAFGNAEAYGGWPFILQKSLDNGIANYARGNATLADYSDTDPTYNGRSVENNHNNTVSSQIRWMLADGLVPDIAIITGGVNDIAKGNGYSFDIPSAVAAYPNTTAAVFQNVAMLICYAVSVLRSINPNVKIYLSTPAKTLTPDRTTPIAEFAANMRLVAEAFGLEIIDFHRFGYQPYPSVPADNAYFYDYTHPSQLGIDMMGRIVMQHLKTYTEP